jgi:hypothetical protein
MEPLNQEERSKAMIRFMSFFTVTLLLTVFAFYFDVLTRNQSADSNREKLKRYSNTEKELNSILKEVDMLNGMIQKITYNKLDESAHSLTHKKFKDSLDSLKTNDPLLKPVCDTLNFLMYSLAQHKFDEAESLKNGETMSKKEADIKSLENKLTEKEKELTTAKEQLTQCMLSK